METQTSNEYKEVIARCKEMFRKKTLDYGTAWRILRLASLTDQIFIKAQRIRSLQTNKEQKIEEGQESEFIGIINYSIMALIQMEKGIAEQPDLTLQEALMLYDQKLQTIFGRFLRMELRCHNIFLTHHCGEVLPVCTRCNNN